MQLRKLLHGTDRPGYLVSALPLPADWSQVWQAAMEEAELPTVLRRALDDSHMPVVTAAAEAIAATLCPTEAEMAVLTFAQACPASGGVRWLLMILVYLEQSINSSSSRVSSAHAGRLLPPNHCWTMALHCNQQQSLCRQYGGHQTSHAAAVKPRSCRHPPPACQS